MLFTDMQLVGWFCRPRIGLMPVDAAAQQYGKDLPPAEAVQAARWIGCEFAAPIHYCDPIDSAEFKSLMEERWMAGVRKRECTPCFGP